MPRWLLGAVLITILLASRQPLAQGLTTAAIRGTVRASPDARLDGARVEAVNRTTGVPTTGEVHDGRFVLAGLEVGGPYVVTVRRIGFAPQQQSGVYLSLGDRVDLHFVLRPILTQLDTVRVVPTDARLTQRAIGTGGIISDSLLHRLPTLDRDLYDFVRLVPQVSTRVGLAGGGLSAGGVNLRFNNFLIDGAPERALSGNSPTAFSGGKSVPIDAVQEYQVLVAPYDVRYGDFAGALINTVTRGGTNEVHGSAFTYARSAWLSREQDAPYDREQYGLTLGGPLVRDRLHFFVAPELQRLTAPARGPYVGQPQSASPLVPVSATDIARFDSLLQSYGLTAGSAGLVQTGNPLRNFFGRLDLALPALSSRAVASVNYARFAAIGFSRSKDVFPLSSYRSTQASASRLASLQLHTNWQRGLYNEVLASYRVVDTDWTPDARGPVVQVAVTSVASALLKAGSQEQAQGVVQQGRITTLTDNLTVPLGPAHDLTIGGQLELFHLARAGVANAYGTWSFASLDSLERGVAERFEVREDRGGATRPIAGRQFGVYAEDEWRAADRVTILVGVRGDVLSVGDAPPYNPAVDSLFARRTDALPVSHMEISPRLGFRWELGHGRHDQLRGGVGLFTGRAPLAWQLSAIGNYGSGIATLRCGFQSNDGGAPRFVPDYNAPPTACASGRRAGAGDVDLLDSRLRMAQTLRTSLAYDRTLPGNAIATVEALVTQNLADFVFVNLNLRGPRSVDRYGRVMYGTISSSGLSSVDTVSGQFSEVIDLRNTSRNRSYQLSASLEKRFTGAFAGMTSYTYSRVRDVQSPIRAAVPAMQNWSSGRAVSGRHDDMAPGVSLNDVPHRVVVAMTYAAPWQRWATDFSMYYIGESGSPFTYVAGGLNRRGDLNADGAVGNDPIYVPLSAFDPAEILFSGTSGVSGADTSAAATAQRIADQQKTFDQLIAATPCLRRQRGRILERNSCREPWANTSILSVRQRLPVRHRALTAQLDVFNVFNLVRRDWGLYRTAQATLLEQVGQAGAGSALAQALFRFDATRARWNVAPVESAYQLQFALRYNF